MLNHENRDAQTTSKRQGYVKDQLIGERFIGEKWQYFEPDMKLVCQKSITETLCENRSRLLAVN